MNIQKYVEFLGLKRPFEIQMKSRGHKKQDAAYWGLYNESGKLEKHLIRIYLGNNSDRGIESLIAHELIHAWQEENSIQEIHGEAFVITATDLEMNFGLNNIYIPGLDT